MAAITSAQALMYKRVQFPGARKLMTSIPGMYKFLENIDGTSGEYSGGFADTSLTAITGDSLTIASGESDGTFVLSVNTTGTNHAVTLKAPVTTQAVTLTLPDVAADTLCGIAATQTLSNKTLTTPTIGSFVNAQHTHADASQGGAIVATGITGSTASTFTVNYGAAVETEIAITSAGTTGGFTATLQVPTLAANRTITFPAVTGTLAILGANTFTGAQTIGTGASIAGSGTGSFDMSGASGVFTTSTGENTLSGNVTISGSKTLTTGTGAASLLGSATFATTKTLTFGSGTAGTAVPIIMYSLTSGKGSLRLAAADDASNVATTITNSTSTTGGAVTITLPSATATLATLGLAETVTGSKTFTTGTVDFRGNVSATGTNNVDLSGSSGTFLTPTGAVTIGSGAIGVSGDVTVAANKYIAFTAGTGYLQINGATSGAIKILPTATGTNTTTIINQGGGSAKDITLPSATCTLPGLGLANSFTAAQTIAVDVATATAVSDVLVLERTVSDAVDAGDGLGISVKIEDAGGSEEQASLDFTLATTTNGAEDCDFTLNLNLAGTITQAFKIDSVNETAIIGSNATNGDGINKLTIYPQTSASGSLILAAAADASGDHATTITNATDAAAAATITLPSGTSKLAGMTTNTATTSAADSLAIPITHGVVAKTTGADGESLTLADGFPGQELFIYLAVDGGGDGVLTPTTKTGYTTITFADAGDAVLLRFLPTVGWIILGAYGYTAAPAIGA